MSTDQDRRKARLDALGASQRTLLLSYLCGAVPETVDAALDFAEGFSPLDGRTAAQITEESDD